MKKLLFILFLLPVFCFAQTNTTPQFKQNIPADSLLGYSIPGVTGNHWLPDTAWVKKHAGGGSSGSFLPLSFPSAQTVNTNSHNFQINSGTTAGKHTFSILTDTSYTIEFVSPGFSTASAVAKAVTLGVKRNSDNATSGFIDDTTGTVQFTSDISGLAPQMHAHYNVSDPHSILDHRQSDSLYVPFNITKDTSVNIHDHTLNFIAKSGSDSTGFNVANNAVSAIVNNTSSNSDGEFEVDYAGVLLVNNNFITKTLASVGTNVDQSFMQIQDSSRNLKQVYLSSKGINNAGIFITDDIDSIGLVGSQLFHVTGDPNQYVQFGNLPTSGNTIYTGDGSLTGDRNVDQGGHRLNFAIDSVASFNISGNEGRYIYNEIHEFDFFQLFQSDTFSANFSAISSNGTGITFETSKSSGLEQSMIDMELDSAITIQDDYKSLGMKSFKDYSANIVKNDSAYTTTKAVRLLIDSLGGGSGPTPNPLSIGYGHVGQPLSFDGSAAITDAVDSVVMVNKTFYNSVIGTATNTALSGKVPTTRTVNSKALSSNITLGLASSDFANQGTTTTVLHGNASGNPSFAQIGISDLSATGTPSSTTYLRGDNTWATVSGGFTNPMTTAGDIIYGGTSGTATRLAGAATDGAILQYTGGLPNWSADPATLHSLTTSDHLQSFSGYFTVLKSNVANQQLLIQYQGVFNSGNENIVNIAPSATVTNTSGIINTVLINPTYNQASGTGGSVDLAINRIETAVGSGAQKFASFQVGGTEKFGMLNTGQLTLPLLNKTYTVATLPTAGQVGRTTVVTDATAPTYLGVLVGGGTTVTPVIDNGSAWVSY